MSRFYFDSTCYRSTTSSLPLFRNMRSMQQQRNSQMGSKICNSCQGWRRQVNSTAKLWTGSQADAVVTLTMWSKWDKEDLIIYNGEEWARQTYLGRKWSTVLVVTNNLDPCWNYQWLEPCRIKVSPNLKMYGIFTSQWFELEGRVFKEQRTPYFQCSTDFLLI